MKTAFKVIDIYTQSRWHRSLLMFLLGALGACALPPLNAVPVLFISIPGFLFFLEDTSLKRSFIQGWWYGFGYFTAGLYWITFALRIDLEQFWWLIPFALFCIPAIYALFYGLLGAIMAFVRCSVFTGCIVFAVSWAGLEWIRGHAIGFADFPWNLLGYVWMPLDGVLQITAFTGIYGLSLLTALFFALPLLCWVPDVPTSRVRLGTVTMAIIAVIMASGYLRLQNAPVPHLDGPLVRIVQPNISQIDKWDKEHMRNHFTKIIALSNRPAHKPIRFTVWPESAVPFFIDESPKTLQDLARYAPGILFVGTLHREIEGGKLKNLYTSVMVVGPDGEVLDRYNKAHLVPFGEYVPLRSLMPGFVQKITPGMVDFSPGERVRTLQVDPKYPVGPLICFEVVFPGEVVAKDDIRPKWLLNLTNDAWYGYTSGPFQHFAITRVRAIEEGIPMVRVANTGISGVFDAYGRVIASIALDTEGVLDVPLPPALATPTLFGIWGHWVFAAMLAFFTLFAGICCYRRW